MMKAGKREFSSYKTDCDFEFHIWKDTVATRHGHDYYEFAICSNGEIIYEKNNEETRVLKKRYAMFASVEDEHSFVSKTDNTQHINLSVKAEYFRRLCARKGVTDVINPFETDVIEISKDEFKYVVNLSDTLLQIDPIKDKVSYVATIEHFVEVMFYAFFKHAKKNVNAPEWLVEFTKKISNCEYFEYKLSDLYKLAYRSQPVVTAAFKKHYGITLVEYVKKCKISYACGLLRKTNLGILDISNRLGFSSLSHFNHLFKEMMGETPSGYRRNFLNT